MKKITFYDSTAQEDAAVCICATLCAAWFNADTYLPDGPMKWIRIATFTGMSLCWFSMAFFNGLRMRKRFAAVMSLFLTLPCFLAVICGKVRLLKFSEVGILIRESCLMISKLPYVILEDAAGINGIICPVFTAALGLLLFAAGYLYSKKLLSDAVSGGGKD